MLDDSDLDLNLDPDADCGEDDSEGWLAGLRGVGGTLFSLLLFLGSLAFLYWNESSGKRHADALHEAAAAARSLSPQAALDPALEGQVVHLSARPDSRSGVTDPYFGLHGQGVALYRMVQMYQWIEYEESTGKGSKRRTSYSYGMDWDEVWHDSSKFQQPQGHENPPMPLQSKAFFAPDARIGPYRFEQEAILEQAIREYDQDAALVQRGGLGDWPRYLQQLPPLNATRSGQRWYQIEADEYYRGNESVPHYELGDLSVTYFAFPSGYPLSVIGAQQGDRLVHWQASNGDRILLAAGGELTAAEVSAAALSLNSSRMHLFRVLGLIGSALGCAGIIGSIAGLLGMIPGIGRLIEFSLVVSGMLIGLLLGLSAIVLGWLFARPWLGLLLLAGLGLLYGWGSWRQRLASAARRQAERVARATALARQRAAERLAMPPAPTAAMAVAGVAGGGAVPSAVPPPPPPARGAAAGPRPAAAPSAVVGPNAADEQELPPLEWEPMPSKRPPAVMPRAADTGPSNPATLLPAPLPGSATPTLKASSPSVPEPSPGLARTRTGVGAAGSDQDLPLPAVPVVPLWAQRPLLQEDEPEAPAAQAVPAPPAAASAATDAKGSVLRRRRIERQGYRINELLRRRQDGQYQHLCFELMQGDSVLLRADLERIKTELATRLRAAARSVNDAAR